MVREPCIVCGHPTGDCTGEGSQHIKITGPGIYRSMTHEEMFVVAEDVFEEVPISRHTKTRKLVARAGQSIPLSKAKELGIY